MKQCIPQGVLEWLWNDIREKLKSRHFPVNQPMPKIHIFDLPNEEYLEYMKRIEENPNIRRLSVEEYGEYQDSKDSCAIVGEHKDKAKHTEYTIIIRKGDINCEGFTLEERIKHELRHIWENLLDLKIGSLNKLDFLERMLGV